MTIRPPYNPNPPAIVEDLNTKIVELEAMILKLPPGRRRSIALTELENASHWIVKAAVHGDN
jgi:hypothetical protein